MKKLYIAGPVTGIDGYIENFLKFERRLTNTGYSAMNPVGQPACITRECLKLESRYEAGEHTWECYMKHALPLLLQSDGVALMYGWIDSAGAVVEFNLARELKIPCKTVWEWIHLSGAYTRV